MSGKRHPNWRPGRALVTGATGGIGGAIARRLAATGSLVVATGRHQPALEELRRGGCRVIAADLTDPVARAEIITLAGLHHADPQGLDLLVAAAGTGAAGTVTGLSEEQLAALVDINLTAPLQLVRVALPALQRSRGRIVLVGSVAGALAVRDEAVYSATKAGLAAFAAALRSDLAGSGVSVTLAVPGAVATPFFERRGRAYARRFPRPLDADRVAAAIIDAAGRRQREVWTPRWLSAVARLRGAAPGTYARLADRFGGTS